jgi:hypothetical protein
VWVIAPLWVSVRLAAADAIIRATVNDTSAHPIERQSLCLRRLNVSSKTDSRTDSEPVSRSSAHQRSATTYPIREPSRR